MKKFLILAMMCGLLSACGEKKTLNPAASDHGPGGPANPIGENDHNNDENHTGGPDLSYPAREIRVARPVQDPNSFPETIRFGPADGIEQVTQPFRMPSFMDRRYLKLTLLTYDGQECRNQNFRYAFTITDIHGTRDYSSGDVVVVYKNTQLKVRMLNKDSACRSMTMTFSAANVLQE